MAVTGAALAEGFSLTNCGPMDRLLARIGLKSTEWPRLLVRALAPVALIWLPLCVMALAGPHAGDGVAIPFLHDLSTHVRFLIVVPVLILVEASIGRRTRLVVHQFVDAELVREADRDRYRRLLQQAGRAFESNLFETVILGLSAWFVWTAIQNFTSDGVRFWFETVGADGRERLTGAGWWYAAGSLLPPFLFMRWIWRYGVWCWLLLRLSRFDLQLVATHPDRAGGLAFVSLGHTAFAQIGFAASCLVSGTVGMRILYEGASLLSFQWPLVVFVALSVAAGVAPLAVFWRPLRFAKERGLVDYGSFASRYVQGFQARWIGTKAGESPLDAQDDIGPLCDIGASYERVAAMRMVPIAPVNALIFAVAALSPMLPLLLTVMPLKDLLKLLMQAMI
jgi:hypothetical protein